MQADESKILADYEPLIQGLTEYCEDFWHDDICQDLRLKLLEQIRNSKGHLNCSVVFKFLWIRRNRLVKKYGNGGIKWVPTNPKTLEVNVVNGDPGLNNYFYSN